MTNEDLFPFKRELSLAPLVEFWRNAAEAGTPFSAAFAEVRTALDAAPELAQPLADVALLEPHRALLDLMMGAVIPTALSDKALTGAFPPFLFNSFYATPTFERLRLLDEDRLAPALELDAEGMMVKRAMHAYHSIIQDIYGVNLSYDYPFILTTTDEQTGLDRFYKINFDTRFVTIETNGEPPALNNETLQRLLAAPLDLDLWREHLPPEHFSFHGFVLITAMDVTVQEVLSLLKNDLLQKDAMTSVEKIDRLEQRLRVLLKRPDLRLGLMCLEKGEFEAITGARPIGRSLLMSDNAVPSCPMQAKSYYAQAFNGFEPVIVNDLEDCDHCTGFEYHLRELGLRNLLIAPLYFEDELVGLLELGSPNAGDLNAFNALKLMEVVSLFATAMKRSLEELEDRVQAVIKEKYTAIHPSVEWRFRKAALNFIKQREDKHAVELEPIVFQDVYPLYGLSDIRNSSTNRNAAIQDDLVEQLGLAMSVVVEAGTYRPLPILDEIGFRLSRYVDAIEQDLSSGDENSVLDFLQHDVEPLFEQLALFGPRVQGKIEAYRKAIDPDLGILYRRRKDFEDSVTLINETVSAYIDEQERHAQSMFPHYFEKFSTDGVDYNIYVGQALVEDETYNPLYLRNLRLWQLMMKCGVAWELEGLKPRLPVALEATHLILVQNTPLSVRFRMEEKQFDVDGAYNIRYEIVKKRIDKARIRGTNERLTQPGKIAIVYSQAREAQEYMRYIEYLQEAGYLTREVEDVELEDLQGVYGLKALRVSVVMEAPETMRQPDLDQVLLTEEGPIAEDLPIERAPSGDGAAVVEA